jgi:iron complex outermembrane receptor protein
MPAIAETTGVLISEEEYFADIPPVDTVTRLPAPKSETPAAVTVLDRDMIRAAGIRDLADIFRLVPGFQVSYVRSHRPAVTYHGLGDQYSRRLQILIDGRSVYNALFGNVSWSSLPVAIDDIERIEIVRGPNTAAYGANAFFGTINIITRHTVHERDGARLKLTAGKQNVRDITAGFTTHLNRGGFRLAAGYKQDDGLHGIPDGSEVRFVNIRSDLQPGVRDAILLQAGFIQQNMQEGYYDNIFSPPAWAKADARFEQIRWQRQLASNNELTLQFYHNYQNFDFDYLTEPIQLGPPFGLIQVPVSFNSTVERYDAELQHTLSPWENWRLVWGVGAREDSVDSYAHFSIDETIRTGSSRVFGNAEWRIAPSAVLNAGAMWEETDFTDADLSPRMALNYHLNVNHTLRAVWSTAQRIPSLFEEKADRRFMVQGILFEHQFHSAGNLESETMKSQELGYLGRFPGLHTTLDVRLYRDRVKGFITEEFVLATDVLDGLAFGFRNEGEVTVEGVDMELVYQPGQNSRVVFNYSRMRGNGTEVPADTPANQRNRLASIPDYSASLMIMHRFAGNWDSSLSYHKSDAILWLSDGDYLPAYGRLDLRIAYRLPFSDMSGEVALVVQNAGDRYEDFRDDQFFKRRAFLTLSVDF